MDERYKILLGSEGTQGSQNQDIFINLELKNTLAEIKPQQYNNTFDVAQQFAAERNTSRQFFLYGIVDSNIINCDNLTISVYSSSGTSSTGSIILSGFIGTVNTTPMVFDGYNAYGLRKGKWCYEVSAYTNTYIYFEIPSDQKNYTSQVYSQQVIFYDANGNFVPYGNSTIEIDNSGNQININNDFYFLYNTHWIKLDLPIIWTQPSIAAFSGTTSPFVVNQSLTTTLTFNVALSNPSTFGNETVDLSVLSNTLPLSQMTLFEDNTKQVLSFPYTMSWVAGEMTKSFYLEAPPSFGQYLMEDIVFGIDNWQNCYSGTPNTFVVEVINQTPKTEAIFNFQNVFQNRNYFTGWRGLTVGLNPQQISGPFNSVLRNGLFYDGSPLEFYPGDNFSLTIQNLGIDTVLPASGNSLLNIANDSMFYSGTSLQFNVNVPYTGGTNHTIQFQFPTTPSTTNYNSFTDGIRINSVPMVSYGRSYNFNYPIVLNILNGSNSISGFNYPGGTIQEMFSLSNATSSTGSTITLSSLSTGTRLDIEGYGIFSGISNGISSLSGVVTATTIQNYSSGATQIPIEITLRANSNSNKNCYYGYTIQKNGYKTLSWTSNTAPTTVASPPTYYLVSGYNNILKNWNTTTNTPVYVHQGVTTGWTNQHYPVTHGLYTIGDVYTNGVNLLASVYDDNTLNASFGSPNNANLTNYGNTTGNFVADFLPAPLTAFPQTKNLLSPQNSSQSGYLIAEDYNGNLPAGYISERSFDFWTGTAKPLTYYGNWHGSNLYQANFIWNNIPMIISGSTVAPYTQPAPLSKLFLAQGVSGITYLSLGANDITSINNTILTNIYSTSNLVKLVALTPGVGYNFTNLKDFRTYDGQNLSNVPYLQYMEIIPNEIFNVTNNLANNWMGGYSTIQP